jgi:hypothetical protein
MHVVRGWMVASLVGATAACARAPNGAEAGSGPVAVPVSAEPGATARPAGAPAPAAADGPNDPRWHAHLLRVARSYSRWMRVDDRMRWAPYDCRLPPPPPRVSAADEATAHAGKLYFLFARDAASYGAPATVLAPAVEDGLGDCKQVVVKEAWQPVALPADAGGSPAAGGWRPAERDGKRFGPGERHGLFVMIELRAPVEGSDEGWIYGTLAADLETVLSAGRVTACIECHRAAPKGRLFGLPKSAFDSPF